MSKVIELIFNFYTWNKKKIRKKMKLLEAGYYSNTREKIYKTIIKTLFKHFFFIFSIVSFSFFEKNI